MLKYKTLGAYGKERLSYRSKWYYAHLFMNSYQTLIQCNSLRSQFNVSCLFMAFTVQIDQINSKLTRTEILFDIKIEVYLTFLL